MIRPQHNPKNGLYILIYALIVGIIVGIVEVLK